MIFPFHRLFPEPAIFGGLFICLWLRQAISYKAKKNRKPHFHVISCFIGVTGFEPTTPSSLTKCASQLRYTPIFN